MTLTAGSLKYQWIDHWAAIVDNESGRIDGRTHGVQVTSSDDVVVFAQANPAVLIFSRSGQLLSAWGDRFPGAHGLTVVNEDGIDYPWLADVSTREVVKTTLTGETLLSLAIPPNEVYAVGGNYAPTSVAVNEKRFGGNGDIWVADGYGQSVVHRYDESGAYVETIDGTDGAGKFNCPHGISFDFRTDQPRLYVADRGNRRVQVFDASGTFLKSFGEDYLIHPDCFSVHDGYLLIPELFGRVAVSDSDDKLVGYLGENEILAKTVGWPELSEYPQLAGWPDLSRDQLVPGIFSSPHGGTFDSAGNVYVVEWIIGGRITKLEKV